MVEYDRVVIVVAVVVAAILAYFSFIGSWNTVYSQSVGSSANTTYVAVQNLGLTGLYNISSSSGGNTEGSSGAGAESSTADLIRRGLSIITTPIRLLGLVPAMLRDLSSIMGIPDTYVDLAVYIFIFSFALVFAYLIIIGVRRLV